jgi:hypothetical protein
MDLLTSAVVLLEASVFIWASPAVAGGYSRVLALAALEDWSWSTSEELDLVGGSWVLPLPLPLGPSRGVAGSPPAVPPSPPRLAAERVLRAGSWGGVGIAAGLWWSPPPAVLARGVHFEPSPKHQSLCRVDFPRLFRHNSGVMYLWIPPHS